MTEWWNGLGGPAQGFYIAALFFSALFVWQLIAALMGLTGGEDVDVDVDAVDGVDAEVDLDHPEFEHGAEMDGTATMVSFKLLGFRSILAFCMLFSWAGGLYLGRGGTLSGALTMATVWGLGAMVLVALMFYGLRHLAEAGSPRIATCVGTQGLVYLDIPAAGTGEARVTVSGVVSHVRARASGGRPLSAGTPIRVTRVLGANIIEVEPLPEA